MTETGNKLVDTVNEMIDENQPLPLKDLCSRYTTDIIASLAFGLECNSLKEPDHIFRFGPNFCLNLDSKNELLGELADKYLKVRY